MTKTGGAFTLALLMLIGLFGLGPAAQAQPQLPNGECFELTVVGTTQLVPIEDYPDIIFGQLEGQNTILTTIPCTDPGDDPDEVLGIVETPDNVLAFTGSSVNTPVTIGFTLLGAGGLALYAARRRTDRDQQSQLAKDFDEFELV